MKVFISSLITGFAAERAAAKRAILALRHEPVMAEDFSATPNSPQIACLQGIRGSDVVALVLGADYGAVQPSGLSATHEEYREARGTKPVLAFVQEGVERDQRQAAFLDEVQGWEKGLFRGAFRDPDQLRDAVTTALLDATIAAATGPVDEAELSAQAAAMLPTESRNTVAAATLDLALVCGPTQRLLRPAEIENRELADHLLQAALFGPNQLFDRSLGNDVQLISGALVLKQERAAAFSIDEHGAMLVRLPLDEQKSTRGFDGGGYMVVLEEAVEDRLTKALAYAAAALEHVDPTQRATHVGIAARLSGVEHRAWRTRAEHAASPNSVSVGMGGNQDRGPVTIVIRRAGLRLDRARLVEDVLVPLRRLYPRG